MESQINVNMTL